MRDIVHVKEGEESPFIERALALGYEELVFLYRKLPKKSISHKKLTIKSALLGKKGADENIVLGTSLLQLSKGVTMLADNEFDVEKDFVHQRRSGLNHVILKECKKKNIGLLFNLSKLRNQPLDRVSQVIGRMKQNAKLAKKYGVSYELVSFAQTPLEMRAAKDVAAMKRTLF